MALPLMSGVALATAACDRGPGITLVNGLDQPVIMHLLLANGRGSKDILLRPGGAKSLLIGDSYSLTVDGCEVGYRFPKVDEIFNYPWRAPDGKGETKPDYRFPYPVAEVLKSDGQLYLAGSKPKTAPATEQAHGFPLSPISKTCAGAR